MEKNDASIPSNSLGVKYESNDQAIVGMTQKRQDTTVELGVIF
jgi:hypothetical protein